MQKNRVRYGFGTIIMLFIIIIIIINIIIATRLSFHNQGSLHRHNKIFVIITIIIGIVIIVITIMACQQISHQVGICRTDIVVMIGARFILIMLVQYVA